MKIRKLDRRYKGCGAWTHRAEFGFQFQQPYDSRVEMLCNLHDARSMLTKAFGVGAVVDEYWALEIRGIELPKWAYNLTGDIYMRDEALVMFQLAMGKWK